METLVASYVYDEKEAVRAVVEVTRASNPYGPLIPWFGVFSLVAAISLMLTPGTRDFPKLDFSTASLPLLFGFLLASLPLLTRWQAKRRFKMSPLAGQVVRWQIKADELRSETDGAEARFVWQKLIKVQEVKRGFLLYPQQRVAHWIPKHAFVSAEDVAGMRRLAQESGVRFKG